MNDRDRFNAKVDRNGPVPAHRPDLGPCHVWTAYCSPEGYGRVRFMGKPENANRVAFFLAHGRWPEPCALHHCDNPSCVNDAHLFEGTRIENNADRDAKGRNRPTCGEGHYARLRPDRLARGERHGSAKLTEQDARDIRAEYAAGGVTMKQLGTQFGVSKSAVYLIVHGKKWAHTAAHSAPGAE